MPRLETINVEDIDFGDRARIVYDKLDNLIASIKENGLIHPIAVLEKSQLDNWDNYKTDKLTNDKPYLLLAGGRRTMAHIKGSMAKIEAKIFDSHKDVLEIKRIELYENLDREDLKYAEEVKLKAEIHDLEVAIHGAMTGSGKGKKGASIRDTASKVGESVANFSQDLKLAEAIQIVPELGKMKNKTEAKKALKTMIKQIEDKKALEKIEEQRKDDNKSTTLKKIANKLMLNDIMEGLKSLPDGSINFIELDPPLGLGFDDKELDRYSHGSYHSITNNSYMKQMEEWLTECHRVLADNSWIVVWYPIEPYHQALLELMNKVGFKTRGIPLVWDKESGTGKSRAPNYNLGNGYEVAFYGRKGDIHLNRPAHDNIFRFKPVSQSKRYHPTEKPIELYMEILDTFARKGHRVVVGFAGSGNCILAAENVGMDAIGFDLSQDFKTKFDLKVYESVPGSYTSYA